MPEAPPPPEAHIRVEEWFLVGALGLAIALPLGDALGRPLGLHIPGVAPYLQQLMLWLTFVGGLVATRQGTHLTLSLRDLMADRRWQSRIGVVTECVAAAVCAVLAYAGMELVGVNR